MTETFFDVLMGDARQRLSEIPDGSVNCCITSPPYFGLRDYQTEDQLGMEGTPEVFVSNLMAVFREVRRTLRKDGTLWLNLGDSYNAYNGNRGASTGSANKKHHKIMPSLPTGSGLTVKTLKNKDLIGIPWMVAFALRADGWYLRQDIIWHKPNPMPESVKDRCTKAHEYIFLLSKSDRYHFDSDAISEPSVDGGKRRNRRDVWSICPKAYKGAHFATFPPDLIEPCVLAGCPVGGVVLDPFGGSGTTAGVALKNHRNATMCEINQEYVKLMNERVSGIAGRACEAVLK
jgi:DNA modification methylase